MTALARLSIGAEFDDERRAAAQRLNDDLHAVARAARRTGGEAQETLERLRRRSVTVYRHALVAAAGVPHDRLWTVLSLSVAAFVAAAGELDARDPAARAAERRLVALARG